MTEKRTFCITSTQNQSIEVELRADRCRKVGENSVEFLLANQPTACLTLQANVGTAEDITPTPDSSQTLISLPERLIDIK